MKLQHHFVVVIDENGEANIDYDTSINFDSGDVWDEETEEWHHRSEEEVSTEYETAEMLLLSLVKQTWQESGQKEREQMEKLSMEYIITELRAFRKALKTGDLDLADSCVSHLENAILPQLKKELNAAFEKAAN